MHRVVSIVPDGHFEVFKTWRSRLAALECPDDQLSNMCTGCSLAILGTNFIFLAVLLFSPHFPTISPLRLPCSTRRVKSVLTQLSTQQQHQQQQQQQHQQRGISAATSPRVRGGRGASTTDSLRGARPAGGGHRGSVPSPSSRSPRGGGGGAVSPGYRSSSQSSSTKGPRARNRATGRSTVPKRSSGHSRARR